MRLAARRYLAGLCVYTLALLLYTQNGYYSGFLSSETRFALITLWMVYIFAGFPFQLLTIEVKIHKPTRILSGLLKLPTYIGSFAYGFLPNKKRWLVKINEADRKALMFALVKLFYVPLMFNFFFANAKTTLAFVSLKLTDWPNPSFDFRTEYVNLFSIIFMVDTMFFVFGYLVEHRFFDNVVRSVEPTALGWLVALVSYPPLNSISVGYLNWYSNDYFLWPNPILDYTLKILIILLLLLYLWATISLGTKCSNLTNRGIVTAGAYKYIRHPAYTGKVLAWWLMALPRFSIEMVLSLSAWTMIYFLRAVTEERHLIADLDYKKYTIKTKFRFVPGLF